LNLPKPILRVCVCVRACVSVNICEILCGNERRVDTETTSFKGIELYIKLRVYRQ